MGTRTNPTTAFSGWDPLHSGVAEGTIVIIGKPGLGKSWLARHLAEQLAAGGQKVGLLSTDMGQASVGVPTCLGLSVAPPWQDAAISWFIGTTTPVGNLLPTVIGTAQLAQYARRLKVQTLLIDTSGLVEGPLGRLLNYHTLVALGAVDHLVALQQELELEPLLALLQGRCRTLHRLHPAIAARDRTPGERRQYREARFRDYLRDAAILDLDPSRLLNLDWTLGRGTTLPAPGTVVGLLNVEGFCVASGLLTELQPRQLLVFTPWRDRDAVAWVQCGRIQLSREGQEITR
jgi:polynucleotide 5'-kinase involved in rRNA processing